MAWPDGRSGRAVAVGLLVALSVALSTAGFVGGVAAQSQQADVVFVFDQTGSMDDVAADLKDEINNVASELEASGVDARYALVTYESGTNTEVRQSFTDDTTKLEQALTFTTFGGTEDASDAILFTFDQLTFREGAQEVVVVLSDEPDDSDSTTRSEAIQELNDRGAFLVSVSPESNTDDDLRNMAESQADNGRWTDIAAQSFTQVVKDIIGAVEEATDAGNTTVDEKAPEFEVANASVENTSLRPGESTDVTVEITNTGDGDGVFNAHLSDSTRTSLYDERMVLDPGESESFTVEVSYTEIGTKAIMINRNVIDRISVTRPQLEGEELDVRDAAVSRSTVAPGETYTVSAVVESQADWRRDATVRFTHTDEGDGNSTVATTETHSLAPGEPMTIRHRVTVPEDAAGTNRTWRVGNATAGTVSVLSSDAAGTGPVHMYRPDDDSDTRVLVLRNGGDEPTDVFVNVAPAEDVTGVMRMVTVGPGEVAELRFDDGDLPDAADADTWWVNGEPMTAT